MTLAILSLVHYVFVTRRQGWASAESVAVVACAIMVAGLLFYRDEGNTWFIQFSILCYCAQILGMLTYSIIRSPIARGPRVLPTALWKPSAWMIIFLIISLILTSAYYAAAGSVPFIAGLQNLLGQADNNVRDLRTGTYQGSSYLAPGYLNQIKNVLLPTLTSIISVYLWQRRSFGGRLMACALALLAVVGLLGTGQRTFAVVFFASLVMSYALVQGRISPRRLLQFGIPFLILFTMATAALGRSESKVEGSEGAAETLSIYGTEVFQRFFNGQQLSAIYAEAVVADWQIPPMSDWLTGLAQLGPGRSYDQSIAGEVGRYYWGGDDGTMPPSMVTSARLNIGKGPTVAFFYFWGLGLAALSRWVLSQRGGSPLFFVGAGGLMFALGTWVSDAPFQIVQWGAGMFAILMLVGLRQYRRYVASVPAASADTGDGSLRAQSVSAKA